MWRWVTRGLVLTFAVICASFTFAQTVTFIGDVDAPDPTKTHSGLVMVRGWALNPTTIMKIELWVDDRKEHDAIMFLPRIDIVEAYPDWPGIHNARPGFITGFLASRFPNGPHTLELRVYTSDGAIHTLGRRTININNTVNQPPFGFTDIPDAAGIYNVSGAFPVSGWAADTDGIQRIEILVDNGILQTAVYGDQRPDVGETFPDFEGARFSGWVGNIDTTRIQNGVHTLMVRAVDRDGLESTIGVRQIQVINNDTFLKPFGYLDQPQRDAVLFGTGCDGDEGPPIISPPVDVTEHLTAVKGWALDLGTRIDTGRVAYAEMLVDGVIWLSTDDCGVVGGRFANCYGVPRYDVQRYYPTFPDSPRSGFIFTLDVGTLLRLGVRPGNHRLMVRVGDAEQTFAELPNRDGIPVWFQCVDDDFDFSGFGHIEFPQPFDYVSGEVLFRGWALEDNADIAVIEIIIDGTFVGQAEYGYPRPDVADQFPEILFARNSGWVFLMDTRKLSNARHRLTARIVDTSGNRSEIGSVDFYVENGSPQP